MILVMNCILDPGARERFDEVTVPRITAHAGLPVRTAHLIDGDGFPGPEEFSHLLISGSELTASGRHGGDVAVERTIAAFFESGRAIIGICYGHQMIARALAGHATCRRAAVPEFGWLPVDIEPDPIFDGITDPVFAHSHYDEVTALPPAGFRVIASTPDCPVQAFRVLDRPVWGIQFHPEMTHDDGEAMFARNLESDPSIGKYLHREFGDPARLDQNEGVFRNFFRTGDPS